MVHSEYRPHTGMTVLRRSDSIFFLELEIKIIYTMIACECCNIFDRAVGLSEISASGNHFFVDDGLIYRCSGFPFEY